MTERGMFRKLRFAQSFTRLQPCATRELDRRHLLASFQFDGRQLQYAALPANHVQTAAGREQRPWRALLLKFGVRRLAAAFTTQSVANSLYFIIFRHRPAPQVANLPAKVRVSTGPRRKAAHAVVNLVG